MMAYENGSEASVADQVAAAEAELKAAKEKLEAARERLAKAQAAEPRPDDAAAPAEPAATGQAAAPAQPAGEGVSADTATAPSESPQAYYTYQPPQGQPAGQAPYAAQPGQGQAQPEAGRPPYQQPYQQPYGSAYQQPYQAPYQPFQPGQPPRTYVSAKDHVAAGLLGIFLGSLGIHKFYLGYNTAGFIMLGITIIGSLLTIGIAGAVMWLIGIIEGIIYLTKSQPEFERIYVCGRKEWF